MFQQLDFWNMIIISRSALEHHFFFSSQLILDAPDDDIQVFGVVNEIQQAIVAAVFGADREHRADIIGLHPLVIE